MKYFCIYLLIFWLLCYPSNRSVQSKTRFVLGIRCGSGWIRLCVWESRAIWTWYRTHTNYSRPFYSVTGNILSMFLSLHRLVSTAAPRFYWLISTRWTSFPLSSMVWTHNWIFFQRNTWIVFLSNYFQFFSASPLEFIQESFKLSQQVKARLIL